MIVLDENNIIGTGGMSVVYKISDALAVKVFRQGITYVDVLHEYDMSHHAYQLNMPTPKPHGIEKIGEQYGIIYDLLKGDTLSHAISQKPEKLEDYAIKLSNLYRTLHSTEINPSAGIPDAHKGEREAIRRIVPLFGSEAADKLLSIHEAIPQGRSLLHCDLHPRNVMLHDGEMMIIDMGEIGYGNPIMDIAHVHALMTTGLVDVQQFVGFPDQYAKPFWTKVLANYFSYLSIDQRREIVSFLDIACLIRSFTWLAVSDGLPQEVILRFRRHFSERVEQRWYEIEHALHYPIET